jgi:2-polyprenyl-3-methyl-5-hydroxy-6-metoxy-1,4-benzoquinol methylase
MTPRPSDKDHLRWLSQVGRTDFINSNLLDLGCGSGYLCAQAKQQGARKVTGIDINPPEFFNHQSLWEFRSLNLNSADWEQELDEPYDTILAFDIIEHLESPHNFLKSCLKKLTPEGTLILTSPNTNSWERFCHPKDWSGAQDPQHLTLFNSYSLAFILKRIGFDIDLIDAPMRSLNFLGKYAPAIGGQLIAVARRTL